MKDQPNVFLQTFALIMFTLKNVPLNTHVIRYMFHKYHPRQRYHGEIEQIEHENTTFVESVNISQLRVLKPFFMPIHMFHEQHPGRTRVDDDKIERVSCELNKGRGRGRGLKVQSIPTRAN